MKDYSEDKKLVERCCGGNESAWGEFLLKYGGKISRIAVNYLLIGDKYGLASQRDRLNQLVVDICSLLNEKLCENNFARLKTYRGDAQLSTWLTSFVTNQTINFMAGFIREDRIFESLDPGPDKDGDLNEDEDSRPEPIDKTGNNDMDFLKYYESVKKKEKLNNVLKTLTPYEKHIFLLKYEEQLSQQQISRIYKKNQGTVGSDLSRAVKKLKKVMAQ